ncbi:MAG: hybrid sensor histidine kinase/response regulator [Gammaproteobacteria bacterium]|nr:hybrid sensor histidine kinase/response regulator [Gammaproteobacteria bacterium]
MRYSASLESLLQNLASPAARQEITDAVQVEIVRQNTQQLWLVIVPQLLSELLLVWLAWDYADRRHLLLWYGTYVLLHHPLELWLLLSARRREGQRAVSRKWIYVLRITGFGTALFWSYAYWAFGFGGPHETLFFVLTFGYVVLLTQYSISGLDILDSCLVSLPIYLTLAATHLSRSTPNDFALVGMVVLACGTALSLILQQGGQVFEALATRFVVEKLAQELREKNVEVTRAKQAVEMASVAKSRFFAAASHDLRQPLHALALLLGSLRLNVTQKKVSPTLQQMETALESLESLFDNVLDVTQLESGKVEVNIEPVSVAALFEKLAHEFKPLTDAKDLTFQVRPSHALVQTDRLSIERILRNLLANAIKYTDRGGILLGCRRSRATGMATIQVFDTGIGIVDAELNYIFEDFYQVPLPTSTARKPRKGVGLGLGIVARLAKRLDHPVTVRSSPGRGSRFELRIPYLGDEPRTTVVTTVDTVLPFSLAGRSILVVDDDETVVQALTTLLRDWRAEVVSATSPAALDQIHRTMTSAPDFVIADFQFEPMLDGEGIIQRVRARFQTTIPAAIMTGNVALVPERLTQMPRTYIFAKPVSPAKLRALLHFNLLGGQAGDN